MIMAFSTLVSNDITWQVHENAALRIAVAMGLFEMIVEGGEAGQTAAELAARSGAEYLLIGMSERLGFFRSLPVV